LGLVDRRDDEHRPGEAVFVDELQDDN